MQNNIMAASSKECLPMLAPSSYVQWKSCFMRYDTNPNRELLKKIIYEGPYVMTGIIHPDTLEDVHMILDGIGNEFTLLWMLVQMQRKFRFLINDCSSESLSTFKMQDKVVLGICQDFSQLLSKLTIWIISLITNSSTKQHPNKVNEIQAERIERNVNPLALVATMQNYPNDYYQAHATPKPYKPHAPSSRQTTSTKSHDNTRNKSKEIVKVPSPPYKLAFEEDSDEEQAQRDKHIQKILALIARHFKNIYKPTNNNFRTSSNTRNKNVDTSLRTRNDRQTRQFRNQRVVPVDGKGETIGSQDTDDEPDEQELEAHYMYMTKILKQPESITNTYMVETVDTSIILDSSDMCYNKEKADQIAKELEDEHVLLASLIANLKLDVDKNKKIQKQLKKANTSLTQELEKYKLDLKYCKIKLERNKTFLNKP
uniref:Integrase, catalytic region, zinc finger, CCHC-type, peptidase aspartic, catalytic n=1 Tax=Tanacetum cinerariifolium TaxID=118510 RepID=A0A699I1N6_TANCI|nr:hypothetical protein [Tanacetum cinerariifolium]